MNLELQHILLGVNTKKGRHLGALLSELEDGACLATRLCQSDEGKQRHCGLYNGLLAPAFHFGYSSPFHYEQETAAKQPSALSEIS